MVVIGTIAARDVLDAIEKARSAGPNVELDEVAS